jgi:hypothetical protein
MPSLGLLDLEDFPLDFQARQLLPKGGEGALRAVRSGNNRVSIKTAGANETQPTIVI